MDPLTAIGLLSGVLTFVSFGTAVVKGAVKIHRSSSGTLEEIRTSEEAADELRRLAARLRTPHDPNLTSEDRDLCVLADECRSSAEQLTRMMEDLKPDNSQSKRQSLWASVKTMLHEKDRKDLEEKLKDLRSRLQIQLTFITSRRTNSSLERLAELIEANSAKFEDLQQFVGQLEQGVEIAGLSELAKSQIQALLTLPDNVTTIIVQHRVLNALYFSEMHGRHDSIEHAHTQTFRWLMHPSTVDKEATAEKRRRLIYVDALAGAKKRLEAHRRFTEWLESGNGIFHISGKLGSGKSTLMKYLGGEAKESRYLQTWAGGRKLVFAQFYFWRHGSDPRKRSLAGLRRALLHDILRQCPELIPAVLPSYWEKIKSMPHQVQPLSADIKQDEIAEAFTRLVSDLDSEKYREHCFCFFIDGLDEYEPRGRDDYARMAELLNEWVTKNSSSNSIKLCVSSRDYNAIRSAFPEERRLHLHELTSRDMEVVVRDGLKQISDSPGFGLLAREILETAQGIFQWIIVVLAYLRDQIANGLDTAEELRVIVRKLPVGIYELYKEVLRLLPDTARAYRTLEMVSQAVKINLSFSVDAYSFFHKYESDNGFIMRDSFPGALVSDSKERTERGKRLLRGCTGGLLEVSSNILSKGIPGYEVVGFTHRSMADFLQIEEVRNEKMKHLKGFSPLDAISQMFLADLRMFRSNYSSQISVFIKFPHRLPLLRHNEGLEIEPYSFLEAVDKFFGRFHGLGLDGTEPTRFTILKDKIAVASLSGQSNAMEFATDLFRPIYLSIWAGASQYPLWKLKKDPSVTDNVNKVALLAYILFARRREKPQHNEKTYFAILDFLYGKNLLFEQTRLAMSETCPAPEKKKMIKKQLTNTSIITPHLTVWQHFLQFEWKYQRQRLPLTKHKDFDILSDDELDARFAKTVLWFLQHGADPTFAACTKRRTFRAWGKSRSQKSILSVNFYFKSWTPNGNETEIVVNDSLDIEDEKKPRRNIVDTPSLRDWILDLKVNDETKQEILDLLPSKSLYETVGRQWRANRKWLFDILHGRGRVQLPVSALLPLAVLLIFYYWIERLSCDGPFGDHDFETRSNIFRLGSFMAPGANKAVLAKSRR